MRISARRRAPPSWRPSSRELGPVARADRHRHGRLSADLVPGSRLAENYAPLITGRLAFISFQTAAELRYGAIRRGWGQPRMLRMEAKIERVEVVHSGPELVAVYARLRADCEAAGHALGQKAHSADRWIAATAIRLGIPLVSNDVYRAAPGLQLETLASG